MYPDMLKTILSDITAGNINGIIIEGTGNGTYQQDLENIIISANEKNIPIIITSVCNGYINTVKGEPSIGSSGINTEDSIKLLHEALNKGFNKEQIHQLFEQYKISN